MKTNFRYITGGLSATVVAFTVLAAPAQAGESVYLSDKASHCEIFRGLSRELPSECQSRPKFRGLNFRGLKTRGIVFHDASQGPAEQVAELPPETPAETQPAEETAPDAPLSISFKAEFEYNSASLTPAARDVIDRVAEVLNHEMMKDKVVQIEGHADASGSDSYNMTLSERRAQAVHEYLVRVRGVDAQRLRYVGKGETELFDPAHPTSGVNRRVEFKNLSG